MEVGEEIGLRIDQTLTQDATGTMVMLELEAMDLDRVKTEVSVQYVDHNLIRADFKNSDDHLFLYTGGMDLLLSGLYNHRWIAGSRKIHD